MNILAHRGYWLNKSEKNSAEAFKRAFSLGFGVEFDIRDCCGNLVVSHDAPKREWDFLSFSDFIEIYGEFASGEKNINLAVNIKSDGLSQMLCSILKQNLMGNCFFFDMSIPEALSYIKEGGKCYTRQSEYEKHPAYYKLAEGVWMDEFNEHWITTDMVETHLKNGKRVCIVSPELHGRDYKAAWVDYKELDINNKNKGIMLCTDLPLEARRYFNES